MLMRRCTYIFTLASLVLAQTTVLVNGTAEGSFEGTTFCAGGTSTVNGWTIVNGTQPNRWAINTAADAQHGSQAIYITRDCNASPPPHEYTINATSAVHFWRDITLPAGQSCMYISAYIKVQGERGFTGDKDYLDVFVAPTSVTPTAGSYVSSTYRLAQYLLFSSSWQQISLCYCGTPGQTYRLIFSWVNDGSVGTQPPAALDQIHVTSSSEFIWTGGAGNSIWGNSENWNGCQIPNSCDADVIISPSAPVFPEGGGYTVRNLTIPAGAKIRVSGTLRICGHLICEGEIEGNGTIEFYGGSSYPVQEIRGTLTGGPYRSLPNVRIARQSPGSVQLMTNVQVRGDLRLAGPNDALHLNGKTLYLAEDFDKDARSGFLHGNGKVVFNGASNQSYIDRASNPAPFYEVEIAQTNPSRLFLNSNLIVNERLTLTSGIIDAGGSYEVRVMNPAPTAVVGGGTTAYVFGKLRRRIGGVGVYDFPIGGARSAPDYQRVQVEFTTAPGIDNLLAEFQGWWSGPYVNDRPNTRECGASYADCNLLSVGYWILNAYDENLAQLSTSGTYTLTLHPTRYSVCSGARQFGILKKVAGEWIVPNPGCYGNPNANIVRRPGLSGFSEFAIGQSKTQLASALPTAQGAIGDLALFPNPTSGEVTIRFTVNSVEPVTITLLNALGQVVEQQTLSPAQIGSVETQLQLSHLPAGNYFVRLTQGGTHITRSLQRE